MTKPVGYEASIPNPALKEMGVLVGKWSTVGSHPYMPGIALHGRATFEWIEGGAFLMMRSEIDEPRVPSGIAIFGSDNASGKSYMVYFDERGVSRLYEFSFAGKVWKWWRNAPDLSQRMTFTISDDGNQIISKGEMSKDGSNWEKDLELTYTRID